MPADLDGVERLIHVVDQLLGIPGCSWDRAQNLWSLRKYLLEETHELLDAMEKEPEDHEEELGDMLFQLVFQSAIRKNEGHFDLNQAAHRVARKLENRHPHLFRGEGGCLEITSQTPASGQGETLWESMKQVEKRRESLMDDIPDAFPALMMSEKVQRRAASVGFDWPDAQGPRDKILEELQELEEAVLSGDPVRVEDELGDVLFAVVNLARHLSVVPEIACRKASTKFSARFRQLEMLAVRENLDLKSLSILELEELWQRAKKIREG